MTDSQADKPVASNGKAARPLNSRGPSNSNYLRSSLFLNAILLSIVLLYFDLNKFFRITGHVASSSHRVVAHTQCAAPLPPPFDNVLPSRNSALLEASRSFSSVLERYFDESDLDSVALAVVTSDRSIFEGYHGPLRANETAPDQGSKVDRDSIYRIASISKLFTTVQTLLLRDKGVLKLDDPISKYIPDLHAKPQSAASDIEPITFRHLLTHMSGLGRDWPPGDANGHWPQSLGGQHPPPYNGLPFPTRADLLEAIAATSLVANPFTFPVYSNTGFALLGYANVAANKLTEGMNAPESHAALIQRDIFAPLELNRSAFSVIESNKKHLVVSSSLPWETDLDFGDVLHPTGGQMSSLGDLVILAQSLLSSPSISRILPQRVLREWFRPFHNEWDGYTSTGLMWEIYRLTDSFGQEHFVHQKLGELISQHTAFSILPSKSLAIVALTTGPTSLAFDLTNLAIKHFMPAVDKALTAYTEENLGGEWKSQDGTVILELHVENGALFAYRYNVNGTDALQTVQGRPMSKVAVWYMGNDEYRLAPTSGWEYGCFGQWVGLDAFGYMNSVPVNLLRLQRDSYGSASSNTIYLPAMQVKLLRRQF